MLLAAAMSEEYLLFCLCVLIAGCVSQAFYSKEKIIVSRSLDYVDGYERLQKCFYFIFKTLLVPYVFTTLSVKDRLIGCDISSLSAIVPLTIS